MAQVLARGVDGISNLNDLAFNSGMSPAQFKQTMGTVHQMFQAQADNTAKSLGFPEPMTLWVWAKQNRPEQLEAAQRSLAFGRNTNEIRNLAKEYRANATYTPAQLSQVGWKVQTSASGETLIQVSSGAWMTTQAATRAGFM